MTMRHTPGTWRVFQNTILDSHGKIIATLSRDQDGFVQGNAYIMAAAPDLLTALKQCLEHGLMAHPTLNVSETNAKARAAIAKAKGK